MERILAVDDNLVNLKVVAATLAQIGYEVHMAESGPEALSLVDSIRPDLIILDINMPEMDGYEVCRRLRGKPNTASIPIMILTAHDTLEEKIKGFEAGADDYLTTPFQKAELQARVRVLVRRHGSPQLETTLTRGETIGVISLRGGVGVSTMSVNLSAALSQIWRQPVALIDLVLTLGQSALMLNLPLRNTWTDISGFPYTELDADLVQKVMMAHPCGVSVLAAPRSYHESETVTPETVKTSIDLLSTRFPYMVLDLPHQLNEVAMVGLESCDMIVAMMAPELASVRSMAGLLEVFDSLKFDRQKLRVVLNWTFEKRGLAKKDIENVLKQPVSLVVPFAPETFVPAINLGVPPVLGIPNSPIAGLFEDFAFSISKEEDQKTTPEQPSESWQRVTARLQVRQQVKK